MSSATTTNLLKQSQEQLEAKLLVDLQSNQPYEVMILSFQYIESKDTDTNYASRHCNMCNRFLLERKSCWDKASHQL